MSETDKFIMEISTALNESGSFKAIQESSISNLGIELDNDSEVSHNLQVLSRRRSKQAVRWFKGG
jgi:hypothetical protein